MWFLFRKEITAFFSSFTGYLVVVVFLVVTGLVLWLLPGELNIPGGGVASLDGLFRLAPWLLLLLIPAVTMRSFAEERQRGTLPLLLIRPVSRFGLVAAKVLASWVLVMTALLPCGVFVLSVWWLGFPPGNMDTGAVLGAFLGLVLMAWLYTALGVLCSLKASSPLVSFLLSLAAGVALWFGLSPMSGQEQFASLGRGVVDVEPVFFFAGTGLCFLCVGAWLLNRQLSARSRWVRAGVALTLLGVGMWFSGQSQLRVDVTADQRYSLSPATLNSLRQLPRPVSFEVFLDGDMPQPMKRLRRGVELMLQEWRRLSGGRISYHFTNPASLASGAARDSLWGALAGRGLSVVDLRVRERSGALRQMYLLPGALATDGRTEVPVNFLYNNPASSDEVNLERSLLNLEYELLKTIRCLASDTVEKIVFLEGHGELPEAQTAAMMQELSAFFQIDRGVPGGRPGVLDAYKAVVIAGPVAPWNEQDQYVLDQYLMKGGSIVWLLEGTRVRADSLAGGYTLGLSEPSGLEDLLFQYGVRINPDVIQDRNCHLIPVRTGGVDGQDRWETLPWLYYPMIVPQPKHPVTAGLNLVWIRYASSVDTVNNGQGIRKTPLLVSSDKSRTRPAPVLIRMEEVADPLSDAAFNQPGRVVALLLEGRFPSAFRNRDTRALFPGMDIRPLREGAPARMLVVSDADLIRNEVMRGPEGEVPAPGLPGYDRYTGMTFGNAGFFVNAVNYLTGHEDLLRLRSREMVLRLLDRDRYERDKEFWIMWNLGLPSLLVLLPGLGWVGYRRWRNRSISSPSRK